MEKQLIPRSELETAEVNVNAAQAQLRSAQAQVTQARASLNQSQVNLNHTVITAPIDGIVISRNVDVGQTVAASMQAPTLFLLAADLTKMKVNASIDEADVGRIRPRQQVRFRVDAFPTEEFYGQVAQVRLQPVVVQNVTTYATVIDVPNPDLKLKPGMTANVTIEVARRDNVVRIPSAALRFRPTNEIFAALKQSVPPELQRMAGRPEEPTTGTQNSGQASQGTSPDAGASGTATGDRTGTQTGGTSATGPGGFDPERRRQLMERLQSMPTEDRERILARMRERGLTPPESVSQTTPPQEAVRRPAAPAKGGTGTGAQTIDSLFGPLPPSESLGRVWLYVGGELKMVRVRLGISDGANTELLSGELQPGTELVTAVIMGTEQATRTGGSSTSPLLPQRGPGLPGVRPQGGAASPR
jgi:multidrug efflux pump subunit AcrA (membrane-fusion protein)